MISKAHTLCKILTQNNLQNSCSFCTHLKVLCIYTLLVDSIEKRQVIYDINVDIQKLTTFISSGFVDDPYSIHLKVI